MRKGGLEPPQGNPHYHLKVARLPIPPLSHVIFKNRQDDIFLPKSEQEKNHKISKNLQK